MKSKWRLAFPALALPVILGTALLVPVRAQNAPTPAPTQTTSVYDVAEDVSRLVRNGKIDELASLNIPSNGPLVKIRDWTSQYVGEIKQQAEQRDKQFADAAAKAQDQFKQAHIDQAMINLVRAYRIAKDPDAFLKLPWVSDMTGKLGARAADLEKQGQWLESLELFSELNTLYEIETRYKADMQRLTRRTRLLAVYAPKALYDMRKALDAREQEAPATGAASAPSTQPDEVPSFTPWQDYAEDVSLDMMHDALENSVSSWVEKTDYSTLVKGGVDALQLFVTTPELATAFPGLGNADARKKFSDALDAAMASRPADRDLTADDVDSIVRALVQASNNSVKLPESVIIMEFTDGAIDKLDQFTAVIWPHEVPEFEKGVTGNFGGVGISISLDGGLLRVISPLAGTPAIRAGIQAGDVITAIEGKSTTGITVDQAVHAITGKEGTSVTLRIKHTDGTEQNYTLTRAIIKVASVKGYRHDPGDKSDTRWDYMMDPDNKIGYIRIDSFQEDTADELRAAITTLKDQGVRGLVLDLRFNPGGLLKSAVQICDMFLEDGTIVRTAGRTARSRELPYLADGSTIIPRTTPLVVLVNEYSASASEIFSGAMKDLKRALIVGHRTYGKGSVQNLLPIGNERRPDGMPDAMMKLTMAYYYLANGESPHRRDGAKTWGVDPDVAVDLSPDQLNDLLKYRRDSDVIHPANGTRPTTAASRAAASQPATTTSAFSDTQLDAGLLMMRLQLVQTSIAQADKK